MINAFDEEESNEFDNDMVQPLELTFISKILEDNQRFLHTKIADVYLNDPLARTIYGIVGLSIMRVGQFQPLIHLEELCKDTIRMENYDSIGYPLDITEPIDIVNYIERFKNETVSFEVIERELTKRYMRAKLEEIANQILDNLDNSKIQPEELMMQCSFKIDSMLFETSDTVVTKTASEVSDDFLAYLASDEVTTYILTGIDAIDMVSGGSPANCVLSWLAPAKCGKSTLLIDSIVANLKQGRVCSAYTIEMSMEQFMHRVYCNYADVSFEAISKKTYTETEKKRLIEKTIEFKELYSDKFFIYSTNEGLTAKHVEGHVKNIGKTGIIVQDIFIDYLQILDSYSKNNASKPEKMAELPKEIRLLRQKTGARIFVPMQSLTSSREKSIENWSPDDIYFSKEAEREFDHVCAMKQEDGFVKWKPLVSRFSNDDTTLFFPNADFNYMAFRDAAEWDDSFAVKEDSNQLEPFIPGTFDTYAKK